MEMAPAIVQLIDQQGVCVVENFLPSDDATQKALAEFHKTSNLTNDTWSDLETLATLLQKHDAQESLQLVRQIQSQIQTVFFIPMEHSTAIRCVR
jgi:hypothetical protein